MVLGLCGAECVPGGCGDAVVSAVGGHTAVVRPVVDEVDDQADAVSFGGGYDIVKALESVGAGVDYGGLARDEGLEPDGARVRVAVYVVEAPDAENFEACL